MEQKPSYADLEKLVAELTLGNDRLKKSSAQISETSLQPNEQNTSPPRTLKANLPEVRLQNIIDSIPQYIFWKDRNHAFLGCNKLFAEGAGLREPADIIGLSDYDLPWKTEEADFFRLCDKRVMDNDQPEFNIVEPQRNAKGKQIWLNTNKIPLHDSLGNVVGILGTYEDISSRIEAEEMLKNYETITATIDDLVAIIDRNHVYKAVNEAHFSAYGVSKEDIIGMTIAELIGSDTYERIVRDKIDQALQGETVSYESWRDFPKWGRTYQQVSYFPLYDKEKKEVAGVVSKVLNITQQKKLETQLQQAQKMEAIGRLAGGIAHDFNNILSVINGYSELCLMKLADDSNCNHYVEMIKESGERAARLTEQLLAFSRKQMIQPVRMNLASELADINQMLVRLLGENIDIQLVTTESVWDAELDRSQLEQIIMNLAVNARDSMAGGGKISIEIKNISEPESISTEHCTTLPGEYIMLAMTDTGAGIYPELQQIIFEPFFTTKDKSKGTGLGLSTVYGIIKQNNGYISVDSDVGKGATFRLYFPRCPEGERSIKDQQEDKQENVAETSQETILLVEDDNSLRQICVEILSNIGYRVIDAAHGQEAVDIFNKRQMKIDLLLTDVVMPVLNGPETARILTEQDPALKVIYMSGYTEDDIVHHGVIKDDINFIQKPISSSSLANAVRKALQ